MDQQTNYLVAIKNQASLVVTPIRYIADFPYRFIDLVNINLASHRNLLSENNDLRTKQLLLEAQIQRLDTLINENNELRNLLNVSSSIAHPNHKISAARILTITDNLLDQQIILDKGKDFGIYVGQPVIDANGVVGQVIEVGFIDSKVLLITSVRSGISVQDSRSGIRAVAFGNGYAEDLSLMYATYTADIKVGDKFITSGLDSRFPLGYTVGEVKSIQRLPGEKFVNIRVAPSARLDSMKLVLLIWPKNGTIP